VPATIEEAESKMAAFALCVRTKHPDLDVHSTVLNVFLPPQTKPSSSDWCSGSGSAASSGAVRGRAA